MTRVTVLTWRVLTTGLLIFGPAALAASTGPLISRIDRLWCDDLLALGTADFTRRTPPARVGRGAAARLRHFGAVAQARHDRRAWARTQDAAVALWDEFFAREGLGAGWDGDLAAARRVLDERAHRWLGHDVKNPEQMKALYVRLQAELRALSAERTRRRHVVRDDDGTRLLASLAAATSAGGPRVPPAVAARLPREWKLRALLTQVLARCDRARRLGGDALARTYLESTFALLEADVAADDIVATRRGLVRLGVRGLAARERVMADVATVPLIGRVIREAVRDLPDAVALAHASAPPAPVEVEPEPSWWPWRHRANRARAAAENAARARAYAEASALHRAARAAEEGGPAHAEAKRALAEAHQLRRNARWVFTTYLAYFSPNAFASAPAVAEHLRLTDRIVASLEARPETPTQDVETAITDVIMRTGESPRVRAVLKAALLLMPKLMDPHAAVPAPEPLTPK